MGPVTIAESALAFASGAACGAAGCFALTKTVWRQAGEQSNAIHGYCAQLRSLHGVREEEHPRSKVQSPRCSHAAARCWVAARRRTHHRLVVDAPPHS